ncbi:mitofusin [Serendipita sp. 399]|nr:mitofusin [Serendipita sp. 399]
MSQIPQQQTSAPQTPAISESVQDRIENGVNIEEVQKAYLQLQTRLVGALESTKNILKDIREFNKDSWIVRYPHLTESSSVSAHAPTDGAADGPAPRPLRRSLSFADDPASSLEVVMRPGVQRSMTLASVPEHEEPASVENEQGAPQDDSSSLLPVTSDFQVLRLDLKLGPTGATSTAAFLVNQLEKASIANLIEERIRSSMNHIDKLKTRVEDTSSKVLVTGDLNAGKSTFVNALLRRDILPVDQQPCTEMFCEVHDAADNEGREEIHLVKEGIFYKHTDESTYTRVPILELENLVVDPKNAQHHLKLYVNDTRKPSESLLHNGIADIALIDAPGLNRDSIKTTTLFARQEEIDVVVFVVSAENHFTLSAKEFLWNASQEKAYLFIVVNRFDNIKDKEKCKRLVLDQIKQLSPRTYEDAEDLVHFVDSSSALHSPSADGSFEKLESDLRSFVLVKRSKSKFNPVTNYLDNVLSDVNLLSSSNAVLAETERDQARADLERARPALEAMKSSRDSLEDGLGDAEDDGAVKAQTRTRDRLNKALDRVASGQLAEEGDVSLPEYPGIFGVVEYTREVKKALLASLDISVKLAEDEARLITAAGVNKVGEMAEKYLPEDVERSRRVFKPDAMFSPRAAKKARRTSGILVAGGVHGLGIGLSQRPDMLEVSFLDIMDVQHRLSVHFNNSDDKSLDSNDAAAGALTLGSLGVGALTLTGGKALGLRGAFQGLVRITDLFSNETVRKWAVPVLGAFTVGLTAYFILELPNTIPKNVGRRIKANLVLGEEGQEEDLKFVNAHCVRVGKETRKVLRIATWDLRERFRNAMEDRQREVRGKEEQERMALRAIEFFANVARRASQVNEVVHQ